MTGLPSTPLVSICMPTYNGGRYLEEALRSAFAQTYPRLEIVVSDDRSSDATLSIIERLRPEAPMPVHVYRHEPSGIGANWNNCVRQAEGAYIKFLFQDDLLAPDCVQRMMDLALTDPRIGLVYCRRKVLYDEADVSHREWLERYGTLHRSWAGFVVEEGVLDGRTYLRDPNFVQQPNNKVGEPTAVMLKKECFERVGGFDTNLKQSLDYVYWYQVMRAYRIGFIDAELATFRLHAEQATQRNASAVDVVDPEVRKRLFLDQFGDFMHPDVRRVLLEQVTWYDRARLRLRGTVRRIFARSNRPPE